MIAQSVFILFKVLLPLLWRRHGRACLCSHEELQEYLERKAFNTTHLEMTSLPFDDILPEKHKVFTYFQSMSIGNIKQHDNRRFLKLWLRAWHRAGYQPHLLTLRDASSHPQYHSLREAFERFPTVNSLDYEVACYVRWLAFRMAGGGIFTDYDLLPFGYLELSTIEDPDDLFSCEPHRPMLTVAGPRGVERQINYLANFKGPFETLYNCPHISDMYVMRGNHTLYSRSLGPCASIVHYSHHDYDQFSRRSVWFQDDGNRVDFAADYQLLYFFIKNRAWMIIPNGINLTSNPVTTGLRLKPSRIRQLVRYPKKYGSAEDDLGGLVLLNALDVSESEMIKQSRVNLIKHWSSHIRDEDIVFLVMEGGYLRELSPYTQEMLNGKRFSTIVPLWAGSPECQMIVDFTLGIASKEMMTFRFIPREDNPASDMERKLKQRFESLAEAYRTIDQRVDQL